MLRSRDFAVGIGAVLAALAAFFWLGVDGYPGGPDECVARDDCYCEAIGDGLIAQPVNTWSNLAFVVAGLAVLADAERRRRTRPTAAGPRMAADPLYARLYGAAGIAIGLGSFAFHGSMTTWGGNIDLISMYAYIGCFVAYDLARIHGWDRRTFLWVVAGLTTAQSLVLAVIPPEHGKWLFGVLVGVALVVEAAVAWPRLRPWAPRPIDSPRTPWFWAGLGSFGAAFVVWNLSRTGAVWCAPTSLWQGHAVWHLLGGSAVWCFYRYFLEERVAAGASV